MGNGKSYQNINCFFFFLFPIKIFLNGLLTTTLKSSVSIFHNLIPTLSEVRHLILTFNIAKHVVLNPSTKNNVLNQMQLKDGLANVPSFLWQLYRACHSDLDHGYQTFHCFVCRATIWISKNFISIV